MNNFFDDFDLDVQKIQVENEPMWTLTSLLCGGFSKYCDSSAVTFGCPSGNTSGIMGPDPLGCDVR